LQSILCENFTLLATATHISLWNEVDALKHAWKKLWSGRITMHYCSGACRYFATGLVLSQTLPLVPGLYELYFSAEILLWLQLFIAWGDNILLVIGTPFVMKSHQSQGNTA
jgi:hypothetical protein